MKFFLKALIILVCTASISFAKTTQLKSFPDLLSALKSGDRVKVIFNYKNCKLISDNEETSAPDATGGMEIVNFEYFAPKSVKNDKGFFSASQTVLIYHPKYGHVYNYVKVKVDEDGNVKVVAQYLDPKTYEIKMDESFYTKISDDNSDKAGAIFYRVE